MGGLQHPLLGNGTVLVVGGIDGSSNYLSSAELYDPTAKTFATTGTMLVARSGPTATVLENGKVLVTGGNGNGAGVSGAELYDPATGTFSATGSMSTVRSGHTATPLPNRRVLMVGSGSSPKAEMYVY